MLVGRTQSQMGAARPYVRKASAKVAEKASEKLGKISFDIRSNKLIAEPYKDLYTKRCGEGGDGVDLHGCYNYVDLYCC